jgi:DNA-binding MarR family transcriptional regulator
MFDRCLYFNINHLAWVVNRKWDEAFKEFGLSTAHAYLLRVVLAHPGIAQKEIGSILQLNKSTITRFIDALEQKGLIKRTFPENADAREQHIVPSAKALQIHEALEQTGHTLYAEMQKRLGKTEFHQLVQLAKDAAKTLE